MNNLTFVYDVFNLWRFVMPLILSEKDNFLYVYNLKQFISLFVDFYD